MNEDNTQKSKVGWKTLVLTLIICGALTATFLYFKGYELYIGGVVLYNASSLIGIVFEIIVLVIVIIEYLKNIRKNEDSKARNKAIRYTIIVSAFTLLMIAFAIYIVLSSVTHTRKAAIAERAIGDGENVLLMENEESFTTSNETFYEITVYYRDGIRLKKIGRQSEYYYSNNNMVKNGQFEVERNGDSITIYYDYGELINGLTWKDEYKDNPPQYVEKVYKLK